MPDARHLRVVTFHPVGPETLVDAALRETCLPALLGRDGIVDAWAGRKGSRSDPRRVLVTTWVDAPSDSTTSAPAMGAPAEAANAHDDQPDAPDLATLHAITSAGTSLTIDTSLAVELAVHLRFDRPEPARILRVFYGTVRRGELDAYVADARTGSMADAVVNDGLVAFALGPAAADAFVTVSAWTGWPAIEEATGGNTRVPIATRNAIRLTGFEVSHFELLPIG